MRMLLLAVLILGYWARQGMAQVDVAAATNQQEITGAFGVVLGTKVNLPQWKKTAETTDNKPLYGFTPRNPLQGFTHYYFKATPKTGIIYCVYAQSDCEDTAACRNRQAVILDLLRKKYGEKAEQNLYDTLSDREVITRGTRNIQLKCTGIDGIGRVTLNLFYTDDDLEKQAEKERVELEGKTINGSGL